MNKTWLECLWVFRGHVVVFVIAVIFPIHAWGQESLSLDYTGQFAWDDVSGTLVFQTSGSMPRDKEEFFWRVPPKVKRIEIDAGVRLVGGFRVLFRERTNPLYIVGKDRDSSVLYGTDESAWTQRMGVAENDKWRYSSVSVIEDATVYLKDLTLLNPRGYLVSGYANEAVIHMNECTLKDTRAGDNNNSDGFAGAAGSSIRNSLISTKDDGIKVYHDITIENVTLEHHRNGAPLQLGWGGENDTAVAEITKLTIRGVDPDRRYNMAPITWEQGHQGVRRLLVDGLIVKSGGELYDEETREWVPLGLFELKPSNCEFHLRATSVQLNGLPLGIRRTKGSVTLE